LEKVGITPTTVTAMVIGGLIGRDPAGELYLTKEGRAVFAALLADGYGEAGIARGHSEEDQRVRKHREEG
jgi:hypothetical protein